MCSVWTAGSKDSIFHETDFNNGIPDLIEGSSSTYIVRNKDFNQGFIISPLELVQGRIPGLMITSRDGRPGNELLVSGPRYTSLSTDITPLLILDGVPVQKLIINPRDIESILFSNDAALPGLYGNLAANGALFINTKKGTKKLKVDYSGTFSISEIPKMEDVYSGDEFRKLIHDQYSSSPGVFNFLGSSNTNWQKEIYQKAIGQDHYLSISGTVLNIPVRASIGKTLQDGILKTSSINRTTSSLRISPSFFRNHLKINLNVDGAFNRNSLANESSIRNAVLFDPTQPVRNGSRFGGYYTWLYPTGALNISGTKNAVAMLNLADSKENVNHFNRSLNIDYAFHFFPALRIGIGYEKESFDQKTNTFTDSTATWTIYSGNQTTDLVKNSSWKRNREVYLSYCAKFVFLKAKLNMLAGYRDQFAHLRNDTEKTINGPWTQEPISSYYMLETSNASIYGNARYSILDKYSLNVAMSANSDSRIVGKKKSLEAGGASLEWNLKNESFLKDVYPLSALNFFLSYNVSESYNLTILPGTTVNINPKIQAEQFSIFSTGIAYSLLKNKVSGSVSLYSSTWDKSISSIRTPSGSNFNNSIIENVGTLANKGLELSLNINPVSTNSISLNLGFTLGYNQNKIKQLSEGETPVYNYLLYGDNFNGFYKISKEGYPANSFFFNKQVYNAEGKPIEGMYVDLSGNGGVISGNLNDKYVCHQPAPDYSSGMNFDFTYKHIELSGSAHANIGNYVYNTVAANSSYDMLYYFGYLQNSPKYLNTTQFGKRQYTSDYFVENASFLRMDYVSLGYKFNDICSKKVGLSVFFSIQNAFVISKYSGLDPEVEYGVDQYMYPRSRTFSLGLNLSI
ncbi:MAG: hypothetical protein HXX13_14595 [Bacteroidetes bacterium]|nr:hypothetical protein [Bacteroidota bacterium]